jgi:hypothetical protein
VTDDATGVTDASGVTKASGLRKAGMSSPRGLYHGQWWVQVARTLFGFESQDADSSGH